MNERAEDMQEYQGHPDLWKHTWFWVVVGFTVGFIAGMYTDMYFIVISLE